MGLLPTPSQTPSRSFISSSSVLEPVLHWFSERLQPHSSLHWMAHRIVMHASDLLAVAIVLGCVPALGCVVGSASVCARAHTRNIRVQSASMQTRQQGRK